MKTSKIKKTSQLGLWSCEVHTSQWLIEHPVGITHCLCDLSLLFCFWSTLRSSRENWPKMSSDPSTVWLSCLVADKRLPLVLVIERLLGRKVADISPHIHRCKETKITGTGKWNCNCEVLIVLTAVFVSALAWSWKEGLLGCHVISVTWNAWGCSPFTWTDCLCHQLMAIAGEQAFRVNTTGRAFLFF